VDVSIDGLGSPVVGEVSEVSRLVHPSSHAFTAKIDLPPVAGLKSGMFGRAILRAPGAPVLTVPSSAVLRNGQVTYVLVDDDGTARMRAVHTGRGQDGRTAVLAGLAAGERVLTEPPPGVLDGTRIAPRADDATSRRLP
jgi:Cu(I)/Ag(I) efflux system membrane fusion protein